ncbi:MAG TPA: hypothetical protein VFA29_09065 [Candidatus Baltobacteraceae bacterium]|nr:hypothetical protein [Candidatus Baltobacteraceae bacterium]
MRASVFVRHHSGDEMGHVGWAFESGDGRVHAGSVENHSGHFFSPSQGDGFWSAVTADPLPLMLRRQYDELKWVDVQAPDPVAAARVVLWIKEQAYRAAFRNCEDDVYDVLRAYGVRDLPAPAWHWLPNRWFQLFRGEQAPIAQFKWPVTGPRDSAPAVDPHELTPLRPPWRRPLRVEFHLFNIARGSEAVAARFRSGRRAGSDR